MSKQAPSKQDRENVISSIMWIMQCTRQQAILGLTVIAMEIDPKFRAQVRAAMEKERANGKEEGAALAGAENHHADLPGTGGSVRPAGSVLV